MWDLPRPGIEPLSATLADGFLTTGPPRKSNSNSSRNAARVPCCRWHPLLNTPHPLEHKTRNLGLSLQSLLCPPLLSGPSMPPLPQALGILEPLVPGANSLKGPCPPLDPTPAVLPPPATSTPSRPYPSSGLWVLCPCLCFWESTLEHPTLPPLCLAGPQVPFSTSSEFPASSPCLTHSIHLLLPSFFSFFLKNIYLGLPWQSSGLRIHLAMQGTCVRSLIQELRPHMPNEPLSPRAATREPA